jgi:Skp family chaperone for outer membrane proteins
MMPAVLRSRTGLVVALLLASAPLAAQQRPAARPAAPAAAPADQGSAPTKVGFVNIQAVLKQTPGYAKAESAAQDFDQQSVALSPTSRQAKRKELEAQQEKVQQRTQELQQRAAQRERELLEPIQQRINSVIEGIRAAGNYAIILDVSAPGNAIITADKSIDLTPRVLSQLQASK